MSDGQHTTSRARMLEIGEEFTRWTVIRGPIWKRDGTGSRRDFYVCRCRCGAVREVLRSNLTKGLSGSCGCLKRERTSRCKTIHGEAGSRLYRIWVGVITRCENEKCLAYQNYGGRGIVLCPEWRGAFGAFRDWAITTGYRDDLTIERKNVNGDYEPGNCTWIPRDEQASNRRNSHPVTAFGETRIAKRWSEDPRCLVSFQGLLNRLEAGWDPEQAITVPGRSGRRNKA
jgi:hypothetical protein